MTSLLNVNGHCLVIKIVSCIDGIVKFTYPLKKNDLQEYTALQSNVYLPLRALSNISSLSLTKSL